ncbi:MAG: hypothetical protein M3680_30550 [Myxococcota bacterium]|nr:hypothetical protein [Myxococcota bacterium]
MGNHGKIRKGKKRPTGRRKRSDLALPEECIELVDPALEGTAQRIGSRTATS